MVGRWNWTPTWGHHYDLQRFDHHNDLRPIIYVMYWLRVIALMILMMQTQNIDIIGV